MAGGAVIGALRVVIGADSAALSKGLKDATTSLSAFGARIDKIALGAAASFAAIGAAIGVAVKGAINDADALGKSAQKIGIPVEELSKLKFAADLADVSMETLSTSMARFNKNIVEVATGGVGPATQAFKAMGISVLAADGTLKSQTQILSEIADKFVTYEDGASKSALAMAIFGKAGAEMIPLLNEGAAGLKKAADEATRFGIVITQDMANGAQNFNDNMTRVSAILNGLIIQFTSHLVPALERASDEFVKVAGDGRLVKGMADALVQAMAFLAKEIAIVVIRVQELHATWNALRNLMAANVFESGAVTKAWEALGNVGKETDDKIKGVAETYKQFLASVVGGDFIGPRQQLEGMATAAKKIPAPLLDTTNAIKSAGGAAKSAKTEMDKLAEAGKRTFEDTRTPAEQFTETVRKLNEQLAAGVISAETYGRAVSKARNEMIKADPAAQMLESALSSAFDRALDGAMSLSEQLKALARDLAKMAAMAAFKALIFGPTGGMGGSGLLGGLFGGNVLGFARGGAFRVGGSGGIDSQLVAFKATPGERVDVRTPGQQRDMGPSPVNVNAPVRVVNAFDAVDFLSKALGELGGERVILNYVRANPAAFRAALS